MPRNAQIHRNFGFKFGLHHADHVFARFVKTHHATNELLHALDFFRCVGVGRCGLVFAFVVLGLRCGWALIDHHCHAQALNASGGTLGMAHRAVHFIVACAARCNRAALVAGRASGGSGCGVQGRGRRGWGGVGEGSRNACSLFGTVAVFAIDFRARFRPLALGVKVFNRGFGLAEIKAQVHLGAHVSVSDNRGQNFNHAAAVEFLHRLFVFGLACVHAHGGFGLGVGHELAHVVNHRHIGRCEHRNTRSH